MDRRCFIAFTGIAATAAPTGRSYPSDTGVRWQPDGVGSLARIGILTPDFDPVPESEFWAMAPPGVSIHVARVPRKGAAAFYTAPNIDEAVEQLVAVAPRVIVSAYTSSSYVLGADADDQLRLRLQNRAPGIPVIITCQKAREALRIMKIRRVALVHPPWFTEEMNVKGQDYFRSQGFEVVHCSRISPLRSFTEVSPQEVFEWTSMNVPRTAQGVFIAGNGLRAVGAIHALEKILRRPVLTANQVAFWGALRNVRLTSKVACYGKLFAARVAEIGDSTLAP
jgi:maleate isomerase